MKRTLSTVLLALSLALSGGVSLTACSSSQSGDSNPDNQTDEVPGDDASRAPS